MSKITINHSPVKTEIPEAAHRIYYLVDRKTKESVGIGVSENAERAAVTGAELVNQKLVERGELADRTGDDIDARRDSIMFISPDKKEAVRAALYCMSDGTLGIEIQANTGEELAFEIGKFSDESMRLKSHEEEFMNSLGNVSVLIRDGEKEQIRMVSKKSEERDLNACEIHTRELVGALKTAAIINESSAHAPKIVKSYMDKYGTREGIEVDSEAYRDVANRIETKDPALMLLNDERNEDLNYAEEITEFLIGTKENEPEKTANEPEEIGNDPDKAGSEPEETDKEEVKTDPEEVRNEPDEIKTDPEEISEPEETETEIKTEPDKARNEPDEIKNESEEMRNGLDEIRNESDEIKNDPDENEPEEIGNGPEPKAAENVTADQAETLVDDEENTDDDPDSSPTGELKNEDEETTVLGPEKKDEVITEADFEKAEKKSVKRFGFFRK